MRQLDSQETRRRIEEIGLERESPYPFAFSEEAGERIVYDWHAHDSHQLLFAASGTLQLETASNRFLLPAQCAIWIPAGIRHRTWLSGMRSTSLFFPVDMMGEAAQEVRVLAVPTVMREMMLYATRWPPGHPRPDELAESYFRTLALLCRDWVRSEMPFRLPRSDHPALIRAMDYTQANLGEATLKGACHAAAMSERSLRRHFQQATGMSWQKYLNQSRMLEAMGRIAQPGAHLAEVAEGLGFCSLSAFTKAFRAFCGETPGRYRQRILDFGADRDAEAVRTPP